MMRKVDKLFFDPKDPVHNLIDLEAGMYYPVRYTKDQYYDLVCLAHGIAFFWQKKREQNLPVIAFERPIWWHYRLQRTHPDCEYVRGGYMNDSGKWSQYWAHGYWHVWTYRILVESWSIDHLVDVRMVDVYDPQVELEADGDESGVWYHLTADWAKLCYSGTNIRLSEYDEDLIADSLRELMKEGN
jgi:hypothetical protein